MNKHEFFVCGRNWNDLKNFAVDLHLGYHQIACILGIWQLASWASSGNLHLRYHQGALILGIIRQLAFWVSSDGLQLGHHQTTCRLQLIDWGMTKTMPTAFIHNSAVILGKFSQMTSIQCQKHVFIFVFKKRLKA